MGKGKKKKQEPQQLWVVQGRTKIPIEQAKNPSSHEIAYHRTDKGEMVPIPNPHVSPGMKGFPLVSPAQFLTTGSALLPAAAEIGMTAAAMKYPKTTIALTGGALARGPIWNMIKAAGRPVRKNVAGRYAANVYPPDAFNKNPLEVLRNTPWRDQWKAFVQDKPAYLSDKSNKHWGSTSQGQGTYESYPPWRAKWGLDPTKEGAYGSHLYSTKPTPSNMPLNMEVQDVNMQSQFYDRFRSRAQVPHLAAKDVGTLENYPMGIYGGRVIREGYSTTGSRGHAEGLASGQKAALPSYGGQTNVPQYGGATGKPLVAEAFDWWDVGQNVTAPTASSPGSIPLRDMVRGSLPKGMQKGPLKPKHDTVQRIDSVRQMRQMLLQHTARSSEGILRDVSVSARIPLRESGPMYERGPYAMHSAIKNRKIPSKLEYGSKSIAKPEKIPQWMRNAYNEHQQIEAIKASGKSKFQVPGKKGGWKTVEGYNAPIPPDFRPKFSDKQRKWAADRMEGKPMSEAQREYFKQSLKTGIRSIGTVADPAKIPQGARLVWGPEDLRAPTQKTNPFMRAKLRVNNRVRETIPYATMAPFLSVEGMRQRHETRKMPAVKATKEPSKPVVSRSEQIRKEIMEHKPFDMELRPLKQRKPAQIKRVK